MANYQFGSFTKSRVEAFSDGVFAIIVTLLVFELKFPTIEHATNQLVLDNITAVMPKLLSWLNSFLIVCVIWMNHHRLMGMFRGIDIGVFWFNNLLLLFSSLIPFPTAVIGDYPTLEIAVCFYGICMALPALCFSLMRLYVLRHPDLLTPDVSIPVFRRGIWLSLVYGPLLYLIGAGLSWVNTGLALACYFFIPVYFIFPRAVRPN